MSTRQFTFLALAAGLAASAISCQMETGSPMPTSPVATSIDLAQGSDGTPRFKGPAVPVGRGVAQTWVTLDASGAPASVGVTLSAGVLQNLPAEDATWVVTFHPKAAVTPFTHVYLGWNPRGHVPPGIYDVPHFDVHFYTQSLADRLLIQPDDPGFDVDPAPQYIPDHYMKVPGGVPQMGCHWVDLLSPEFNGGTFTETFIWGTFNGDVTFFEPMITKAFLESEPDQSLDVRQPQAWQRDGYYPTSYRVTKLDHPERYEVALEGLTYRTGQ